MTASLLHPLSPIGVAPSDRLDRPVLNDRTMKRRDTLAPSSETGLPAFPFAELGHLGPSALIVLNAASSRSQGAGWWRVVDANPSR